MIWQYLIEAPWTVFVVYWVVSAAKTQRTASQESLASRTQLVLLETIGFSLLFWHALDRGWLGRLMIRRNYAVFVLGVVLAWTGIGLAVWARRSLGQYWSGRITIKEDHKLIKTGPYAHFRHPIYSGIDLAVIGSALVIDRWRCAVGVAIIILGFWIKARKEESLLAPQFRDVWKEHCHRTGFLLPKF